MKSFTKFFMVVSLLGLMMMSCDNRTEEQMERLSSQERESQTRFNHGS